MKGADVTDGSTDSFQKSRKERQLWFPSPSQPSLKRFDMLREIARTFQRYRDTYCSSGKFLPAQIVIMKLNTHNSFIKQLHCVLLPNDFKDCKEE